MERKGFKSAVLHDELEPGSQLRGGALETAGIDSESLAEGSGECKNFKSSAEGEWKANSKFGGAERNRTADEGFADPCLTTWLPRHPVLRATTKPQKMKKPTCQSFRRWATISWGWT